MYPIFYMEDQSSTISRLIYKFQNVSWLISQHKVIIRKVKPEQFTLYVAQLLCSMQPHI